MANVLRVYFRSLAQSRVGYCLSSAQCNVQTKTSSSVAKILPRQFCCSAQFRSKQSDDGSKQLDDDDLNRDEPIKYSSSGARTYSPYDTFFVKNNAPWYQSYSVMLSTLAFIVYFFLLREENDLDEEIGKSLFERIPGLEAQDLRAKIKNAKQMGLDTTLYEKRLNEISNQK